MKLECLFIFVFALLLLSCKKNDRSNQEPPVLHQLVVNVNAANMPMGNIEDGTVSAEQSSPLSDRVKCLNYYIYNSSGTLVKTIKQAAGATGFGMITDSIASGTYTLVFTGGQTDIGISGPSSLSTARIVESSPQQDLFFKKLSITVSDEDLSQEVTMGRIEGYFQVTAEDVLPEQVASAELLLRSDYQSFSFSTAQVLTNGGVVDKRVKKVLDNASRQKLVIGTFAMNTVSTMTSSLTFYDAGDKVIKTIPINNVKIVPNEKMMFIGKLYTLATGGFSIGVDDNWADSVIVRI